MRIKINNWNFFEKVNACYFTRNINIYDELEVYAIYEETKRNKTYLLVYVDFYTFKKLIFIEDGDYYDVLDDSFTQEFISVSKYVSTFKNEDGLYNIKMTNLIAKKWMIEEKDFFARVVVNDFVAQEKFESIEI